MADSLRISLRFEFFSKLIVVKERQPANAPASIVSTLAGILIDTILHPENTPPSFPPLRVLSFDPCSKPMFSREEICLSSLDSISSTLAGIVMDLTPNPEKHLF